MLRSLLPALVWHALAAAALAAPLAAAPQTAKEGESGHRYPVTVRGMLQQSDLEDFEAAKAAAKEGETVEPPKAPVMELFGLAVREKTIFAVNVYSYVLYVDREHTKEALARFEGVKLSKLEDRADLFAELLKPKGTKELRMRFCRDVESEDVVSAFEDSLKPRILERRKGERISEDEKLETLRTFRAFFSLDELEKNNELRFTWHPDGTLSTVVNGERKDDLEAPHLAASLFDVYIGDDPISKSGKRKLVKRLPEILTRLARDR